MTSSVLMSFNSLTTMQLIVKGSFRQSSSHINFNINFVSQILHFWIFILWNGALFLFKLNFSLGKYSK